jgi:hypothetical protein
MDWTAPPSSPGSADPGPPAGAGPVWLRTLLVATRRELRRRGSPPATRAGYLAHVRRYYGRRGRRDGSTRLEEDRYAARVGRMGGTRREMDEARAALAFVRRHVLEGPGGDGEGGAPAAIPRPPPSRSPGPGPPPLPPADPEVLPTGLVPWERMFDDHVL